MIPLSATIDALKFVSEKSRAPRLRTMREFAEQEIRIPDGRFSGMKFRVDRQPWTESWFEAIDSGEYRRYSLTGPTQSGKSLCGFVIPTLYHLFEIGENVVCGVPDIDIAADKWVEDFRPAIEKTRYVSLIPKSGSGSRGGKVRAIKFRNGATLRFMTGGGGDKSRSAFTSRVLVITETDGLAAIGGTSVEADKIKQMMGRLLSYGDRGICYMECTVSTDDGLTWINQIEKGTGSEIYCKCSACKEWVKPDREDVKGWEGADDEIDAEEGRWTCPSCQVIIEDSDDNDERRRMNRHRMIVHRGQSIDSGEIVGDKPKTRLFSFRYGAFNNMFLRGKDLAAKEWQNSREDDEENADREMEQFFYARPPKRTVEKEGMIKVGRICKRQGETGRGIVPDNTAVLTVGVDVMKYILYYTVIAWLKDGTGLVIDYGTRDVPSHDMPTDKAIMIALRSFRENIVEPGFPMEKGKGRLVPTQTWVDRGWKTDIIQAFCDESGNRFHPVKGYGTSQDKTYTVPQSAIKTGLDYCFVRRKTTKGDVIYVRINADEWKSRVWDSFGCPTTEFRALSLFKDAEIAHKTYARHLTSEMAQSAFVRGKGVVKKWIKLRDQNHYFDTTYIACCASHYCGIAQQTRRIPRKNPKVRRKPPGDRFGRTLKR